MVTSLKRFPVCIATLSAPHPAAGHCQSMPPLQTPGRSQASLGKSLMESLTLLSPGSWCAQSFVCTLQESVSPVLCKFCNEIFWLPKSNSLGVLRLENLLFTFTFTKSFQVPYYISADFLQLFLLLRFCSIGLTYPSLSSCWDLSPACSFFFLAHGDWVWLVVDRKWSLLPQLVVQKQILLRLQRESSQHPSTSVERCFHSPQSAHQRDENYPQADVILLPWSAKTSLGQLFTGQITLQSPQNSDGHLELFSHLCLVLT